MTVSRQKVLEKSLARARWRASMTLLILMCMFVVIGLLSIGIGAVSLSPVTVLAVLLDAIGIDIGVPVSQIDSAVVTAIRLPRTIGGFAIGAALAVTGAILQGLFRNPLADPGLVGISNGAALAAVSMIVFGGILVGQIPPEYQRFVLPVVSFVGALLATSIVFRISRIGGNISVATMLLAGIAIGAIAAAGIGMLIFVADDNQLRTLNFWMLGSLGGLTWDILLPAAPFMLLPCLFAGRLARGLNLLSMGDDEAGHLGLDANRFKRLTILLIALATGAAVAVSGIIAFIGLVVPHLLRLSVGPDHRLLLPGAALLGASLLVLADVFARTIVAPAELPLGVITSLIGGPFFLWLLLRQRRVLGV